MSLQYIIDGYNIINNPLFAQQSFKKASDSRDRLIEFIRTNRLCGSRKNKITVVFDGSTSSASPLKHCDINIVFSKNKSADELIKKIVERADNPKELAVVSDDKEIKFFVRSVGARVFSVQEFINRGKNSVNSQRKESLKPELSYSQMHKINQELRQIWLK